MSTLAIETLRGRKQLDPGDVDAFLERHRFPLVEGRNVTFVFRGDVDTVNLRHWIYGLPFSQPLKRLAKTDLWYIVEELPPGSRIEYKFEIVHGPRRTWIQDPLNPRLARDPFGANSVAEAEGYSRPEWTFPHSETREGTLQDWSVPSAVFGGDRPVVVYLPARMRPTRRYPLLVVHDGIDFLRYAQLKTVLDNLIHRLEIPPMVVALTQSSDRLREYGASPEHGRFIVEDLVPLLERELSLIKKPEARGLLGASFGGVASLSTAWRHQGVFDRLCLLSGSFAFTDIGKSERGPAFEPVVAFMNEFRANPGRPASKLFVSCGVYESLIYENRSLVPLLQAKGMDVRFVEVRDGHNWENWRDRMREGLSWLFPGPLWMVYE
jgi:enterochelin esterase family protein